MTTASGKFTDTPLSVTANCCYIVCQSSDFYCHCRATFDRIAEININIDAGQDSVSLFTYLFYKVVLLLCL